MSSNIVPGFLKLNNHEPRNWCLYGFGVKAPLPQQQAMC